MLDRKPAVFFVQYWNWCYMTVIARTPEEAIKAYKEHPMHFAPSELEKMNADPGLFKIKALAIVEAPDLFHDCEHPFVLTPEVVFNGESSKC